MPDKLWNATYWADRLKESTDQLEPVLTKLYQIPIEPLTYEELLRLRSQLDYIRSYSHNLHRDMHRPDPIKPSFIDRLLRKK